MAGEVRASVDDAGWPLAALEGRAVERYLVQLAAGQPGDAQRVEALADIGYDQVQRVIGSYASLKRPVAARTHRAYLHLLDRTTRSALSPWPVAQLYSDRFAEFLVKPVEDHPIAQQLFVQLMHAADHDGLSHDAAALAIALTPEASLAYLAADEARHRSALLRAWNSRLAAGGETRPIANLEQLLPRVAATIQLEAADNEGQLATVRAGVQFLGAWSQLRPAYEDRLAEALTSEEVGLVKAGLEAQQRYPAQLALNETVISRFADEQAILELALGNFAFDPPPGADHSATLRKLWATLDASQTEARFACLLAMSVHRKGNAAIALEAAKAQPWLYLDVAAPVLEAAGPEYARPAVESALQPNQRGQEVALRLARSLDMRGFEPQALAITFNEKQPQILRQAALAYLSDSAGEHRRKLLPMLAHPNRDIRLAAILAFGPDRRLDAADMNEIGPALVQVAMNDREMGHRQEAIHALGKWEQPDAEGFFRKVLADNPPVILATGPYGNDGRYWQYRHRLVALLALARLGDEPAYAELIALHSKGGPAEKTDVLLAMSELGRVPDLAFDDLNADEPKLVATAVDLIRRHGSHKQRHRLMSHFAQRPLWAMFSEAGVDDHQVHRLLEVTEHSLDVDHRHAHQPSHVTAPDADAHAHSHKHPHRPGEAAPAANDGFHFLHEHWHTHEDGAQHSHPAPGNAREPQGFGPGGAHRHSHGHEKTDGSTHNHNQSGQAHRHSPDGADHDH